MTAALTWLAGIFAAIVSFFAFRKHARDFAVAKEKRELNRAVQAVERQLAKHDEKLDAQSKAKIETIRSATRDILQQDGRKGSSANALISKIRGNR